MKSNFFHSLSFKVAGVIILIEFISLTTIGSFYVTRFSQAVDERLVARIRVPGNLLGQNMLYFDSVSDRKILQQLLDDQAAEAMIVGANGMIYHSLTPQYIGQNVARLPENDHHQLLALMRQPGIEKTFDGANSFLTSVSPISVVDGRTPYLFAYFKMRTTGAEQQKRDLRNLFITGSLIGLVLSSIMILIAFRFIFTSRIDTVLSVLRRAERGDLHARVTIQAARDEIGLVQAGVNAMIDSLEQRVNDLAEVPVRILDAQESERHRVARELHDGVVQSLTSIRFRIRSVETKLEPDGAPLHGELARSRQLLDDTIREVRQISHDLRPTELDDLGLLPAIESACRNFRERTAVEIFLETSGDLTRITPATGLHLYRIIQEALGNVEKHSQAKRAWIRLTAAGSQIELKIEDDGVGDFAGKTKTPSPNGTGLGLLNMRDRANSSGGSFNLSARAGGGAIITVRVPLQADHALDHKQR